MVTQDDADSETIDCQLSAMASIGNFFGAPDIPSYPNAGRKGMKIYSTSEISRMNGYERLHRIFWNRKAEELCSDKVYSTWSKTAIQGIITTDWTLKKTSLLYSHARKVVEAAYADSRLGATHQKKNTIKEGMLAMLETHKLLLQQNDDLRKVKSDDPDCENEMERIEQAMKGTMTNLKKRQESVRKSLENLCKERGLVNTEVTESLEVSAVEVKPEEIETIIDEIIKGDKLAAGEAPRGAGESDASAPSAKRAKLV